MLFLGQRNQTRRHAVSAQSGTALSTVPMVVLQGAPTESLQAIRHFTFPRFNGPDCHPPAVTLSGLDAPDQVPAIPL